MQTKSSTDCTTITSAIFQAFSLPHPSTNADAINTTFSTAYYFTVISTNKTTPKCAVYATNSCTNSKANIASGNNPDFSAIQSTHKSTFYSAIYTSFETTI